jgi:hypothetical protein
MVGADSMSLTAIGLVRSSGEFTIDASWTRDNSTVFDGSGISTTHAASHVVLVDGTRIDLGLDSRTRIYHDHVNVEQGLAQVNASDRYAVNAGRIRIYSPQRTLVRVTDSGAVAVTALQGVTEVKDARGILVAMVPPGRTLEFSDADTPDDAAVAGCLERIESNSGGRKTVHYVLQDQTTNMVVELVGTGLEPLVGKTVGATGTVDLDTKAISPAAYTIRVRDLNSSSQQTCTGRLGTPPGLSAVAGCLQKIESTSGGRTTVHYVLEDQTTHVVVELVGTGLEPLVGKTVGATGTIDPHSKAISPAVKIIRVRDLNASSQQTCTGRFGAASRQAPPAVPGLPGAANGGIIGGIGAGGTLAGLCKGGVICSGGPAVTSPSPGSR